MCGAWWCKAAGGGGSGWQLVASGSCWQQQQPVGQRNRQQYGKGKIQLLWVRVVAADDRTGQQGVARSG